MQDLSGFSVPKGFRGGNAIKVQLWWAVQATLFAWSPQVLYRWRAFLLRLFGAKIGELDTSICCKSTSSTNTPNSFLASC